MLNRDQILEANKAGLDNQMWSYYTPALQVAMNLGLDGVDLASAPIVTGYRYGKAPESFVSTNYSENKSENGLSLAAINGEKEIGSSIWFADREKVNYTGILCGTGSDGEPVIIAFEAEYLD